MITRNKICSILAAVALLASGSAYAGDVTGSVKFEGKAPVMKPITISADAGCEALHKDNPLMNEILVLGEGQTMANVLLTITKGLPEKEYPAPKEPFKLTQMGCQYSPHVFAIQVGQTVKVANPDGLLHNVHNEPALNTAVNRAMPGNVAEIEMTFDKVEKDPFVFKCDIHPWMQAWCAVLDNPFFAVTKEDGKFSIKGLDAGEYEVTAWHEKLGKKTLTITVPAEGSAQADFTFAK